MERTSYTTSRLLFSLTMLLILTFSAVDTHAMVEGKDDPTTETDIKPSFPGGELVMLSYVQERLKCPEAKVGAQNNTMLATFLVDKKGRIKDVSIEKGISAKCNASLIQVINSMPLWNPGRLKGKKVDATYQLPITF